MEDDLTNEVTEMLKREFGGSDITTHMDRIRKCLDRCDYLSVFEMDSKSGVKEIDVAMLQALLKGFKKYFLLLEKQFCKLTYLVLPELL